MSCVLYVIALEIKAIPLEINSLNENPQLSPTKSNVLNNPVKLAEWLVLHSYLGDCGTSIKQAVSTLYRHDRVRSLTLQPLSAGNSAEFSEADNSRNTHCRAINLTSFDALGSCESIYVCFKPINLGET